MILYLLLSFTATIIILYAFRILNIKHFIQPQRRFIKESRIKAITKPIPCGGFVLFVVFSTYTIFKEVAWYYYVTLLGFFAIGLLDDIGKIWRKSHISLISGKWRLVLEILLSLMFVHSFLNGEHYMFIIKNNIISIHPVVAYICLIFLIVGTVNAVNLTDGQDTLAGKTVLIHLLFLLTFAITGELLVLTGALLAFLLFNSKPATIYMGDSGSMFLGAFLATAFMHNQIEYLLPLTGIVFVVETLSVIIQVSYFKASHGKRIFKMSPFHHHLSLSGMSEERIVSIAMVITTITCLCSYLILH